MVLVRVTVDVREGRSDVPAELQRLGVGVEFTTLRAGDYEIGSTTLVERKTAVDLASSMQTGRLWRQLGMLRHSVGFPVLLIEGSTPEAIVGRDTWQGLIVAIADQGIVVLRSSDAADSARWLRTLARRRRSHVPRDRPPHTYPRRLPKARPGEELLCSIPHISVHHARALIDALGSVRAIVEATPDDWLSVRGIGPARAEAMARAFGEAHP